MIEPFRANILRERPETSATDVTDVRLKQIVLGLINDDSYCFATLERGMGLLVQVDVFGKHLSASGGWKTVRWRTNAN